MLVLEQIEWEEGHHIQPEGCGVDFWRTSEMPMTMMTSRQEHVGELTRRVSRLATLVRLGHCLRRRRGRGLLPRPASKMAKYRQRKGLEGEDSLDASRRKKEQQRFRRPREHPASLSSSAKHFGDGSP